MPTIGLDLGKNNFKAVELVKEKDKFILKNFGIYENPKLNLEAETEDDEVLYTDGLKAFFSEVGFGTPDVVAGLDESHVFMRVIKIPKMPLKELRSSIKIEAEQYIPFPLKEMTVSYEIIEHDLSDKNKMTVQLVAARNSISEKYRKIIRGAHLIPKALEPEAIAVGRLLGDTKEEVMPTLILNIGKYSTYLIVTSSGSVRFTRSIAIGGDTISRHIEQQLKLDYVQAEEYKKAYGLEKDELDGKVYNVIIPLIDNVIAEIKRSVLFFTTHNPGVTIKRIVICGGTAQMPGLLYYMANNIDVEVSLANPWKNIQFAPNLSKQKNFLNDNGPVFATAVGLGIKPI